MFWSQSVDPHATKGTSGVYQSRSEGVVPRVSRVWTLEVGFSRIILHCNQQKRSWNVPSLVLGGRRLVLRWRYMRKGMAYLTELSAAMRPGIQLSPHAQHLNLLTPFTHSQHLQLVLVDFTMPRCTRRTSDLEQRDSISLGESCI